MCCNPDIRLQCALNIANFQFPLSCPSDGARLLTENELGASPREGAILIQGPSDRLTAARASWKQFESAHLSQFIDHTNEHHQDYPFETELLLSP